MRDECRVLIVGGGVAGPMLAMFLQKAGIATVVYEAGIGPSDEGGGLGLAKNGMAVLQAAGVLEAVKAVSVRVSEWSFENQGGKVLARIAEGSSRDRFPTPVMITRAALHQTLAEAVHKAGGEWHYGKRLARVDDKSGQPIVLHFEDGSTAEGDILVGADGIRSQVRKCVMPDAPRPSYTGMLAPGGFSPCRNGSMPGPQSPEQTHFRFGRNGFFGFVPVLTAGGPRTMWWSTFAAPLPGREETASTSLKQRQEKLLTIHRGWADPVLPLIQSSEAIFDIAIHDVPSLPRWSAGRTVLMGDAAHAVAPHSGQGASMALEDAIVLARLIRDRRGEDVKAIFAAYEKERRPRTDRVIEIGRKNAQRKEQMSAFAYWMQQQLMRLFLPTMQKRLERQLLDYPISW